MKQDRDDARTPERRTRAAILAFVATTLALSMVSCGETNTTAPEQLDASALSGADADKDYLIGPLDKLSIRVFEVQDLSLDGVQVDASGQIVLPLVGSVRASGKTTDALAREIAARLGERYLQSPQVSVTVQDSASQKVTVEGEVKSAGVFKMNGRTTLMQALAMAGGPADEADLHEVAIIRVINSTRKAAICDFAAIRDGRAPDPILRGDDVIIMGGSTMKTAWNDLLKSLPLFALFAVGG